MSNKKYIFMTTFLVGILISLSTQCGISIKKSGSFVIEKDAKQAAYYDHYNPILIKYFF